MAIWNLPSWILGLNIKFYHFYFRASPNQIVPSCSPVGQEAMFEENRLCRPKTAAHFQPDLLHNTNLGDIWVRITSAEAGAGCF